MPPSPPLLSGRSAIITGATAGIGEAIARDLASHACACVINSRRESRVRATAQSLEKLTPRIRAVAGDCADDAVITNMFSAALGLGTPGREADLVIVNAGRGLSGSVVTSDTSQWEEMVRTNVLGAAKLIRAAATRMLAEASANNDALRVPRDIVVIGSTVGRHISPFSSMYGATKFAVNSLAEAARRELGPKGIRVTLIEPAFVASEFQGVAGYEQKWFEEVKARIGPVLDPADIARTITFVVSQPPAVHLSDVLVRPTRQDYP